MEDSNNKGTCPKVYSGNGRIYVLTGVDASGGCIYSEAPMPVGSTARRRRKSSIPCPTICVAGHFKNRLTTPCSGNRQIMTDASVDFPYTNVMVATGGTGPYTYTVVAGTLPTGTSITGDTISGTPTDDGGGSKEFDFTIQATDANGCTGTQEFSITVSVV